MRAGRIGGAAAFRVVNCVMASAGPGRNKGIRKRKQTAWEEFETSSVWMSYWQPADRDRGNIRMRNCATGQDRGILDRKRHVAQADANGDRYPSNEGLPPVANLLALAPAETGKPFLYYLGAGWIKSGDFAAETDWENYVRQFAARLQAPLKVVLKNKVN